ncbi:hypothetical protein WMY93_018467 [Mugilogobius chulae]|uniref:SEC23 interacting protein n=1 Tax=Mugilogobius chulae TaxID=88201 RepID=A0AAW0NK35_9GOBI
MAERIKKYPDSGSNLLFNAAPEFNFNLPFLPVSQASGPALMTGDDSVGEEDSFVGQTSDNGPAPSTFNYFSNPVPSDPFASIGQQTCPPQTFSQTFSTAPPSSIGLTSAPPAVSMTPPPAAVSQTHPPSSIGFNSALYQSPVGRHTPPPPPNSMTPPLSLPPQSQPQSHNPYRHTPSSSRASPYIPAPEILPSTHAAPPAQYPYSSPQQTQQIFSPPHPPPSAQSFNKPPPSHVHPPPPPSVSGAVVPAGPTMPYNYNVYETVQPHWFYCKQVESKSVWLPFSIIDSLQLEEIYNSVQPDPENVIVRTDGGRYDVQLYDRLRSAVYWDEEPTEVRRCTWFYKGDNDSRFIPYSEEFSEKLEVEYKRAVSTNQWHRRLEFPSGETIVMHNPKVIVQFQPSSIPDEWGTTQDGQTRPRVVKRGIDDDHDEVPDGELATVDHLVFMVHGIGPVCDLRFRSMVECVDDFRSVSLKLLQTHFKKQVDEHSISRVEFLPVQWHTALHGDATGVDRRIKKITLPSTGRLRHFTNETLLDVLFYNSPTYCQTIMDTVALEMNRLYALFMERNPDYRGSVSVAGHSLGSLILFDLLSNQNLGSSMPIIPTANGVEPQVPAPVAQIPASVTPPAEDEPKEEPKTDEFEDLSSVLEHLGLSEYNSTFDQEKIDLESFFLCTVDDLKDMGIPLGPRKKIAKFVKERLSKQAEEKTAVVKEVPPVAAPQTAAPVPEPEKTLPVGVSSVHVNYNYFKVGTGSNVPLCVSRLQVSVVYHNLDFEPVSFFALGSPIGMFLTVRGLERIEETYHLPTCKGFFNIYHPLDPVAYRIEPLIIPELDLKPRLKESLTRMGSDLKQGFIQFSENCLANPERLCPRSHFIGSAPGSTRHRRKPDRGEEISAQQGRGEKDIETPEPQREEEPQVKIGMLNGGNRIDYVLQENLSRASTSICLLYKSHLCYWESEDTALPSLKKSTKPWAFIQNSHIKTSRVLPKLIILLFSYLYSLDDFRSVSLKLLQTHFKKQVDEHSISRVEFLPVQWHTALHGDATGVDRSEHKHTKYCGADKEDHVARAPGRLRHFTNETLLDVLSTTARRTARPSWIRSPWRMNRLYATVHGEKPRLQRIQCQWLVPAPVAQIPASVTPPAEDEPKEEPKTDEFEDLSSVLEHLGLSEYNSTFDQEKIDLESFFMCTVDDLKDMGIPLGPRKKIAKFVKERLSKQAEEKTAVVKEVPRWPLLKLQPLCLNRRKPFLSESLLSTSTTTTSKSAQGSNVPLCVSRLQVSVVYHNLDFEPVSFFALGSPIGMFLTVRGLERIEETYHLPTCKGFFNIYHPLDPVAYRIEPLIIPELDLKPVLIPHHKGRKRLHLELKESLTRMGSDLKQGFISSLRTAWQTLNNFARAHTSSAQLQAQLAIVANQIEEEEISAQQEEKRDIETPEPQREEEPQVKSGC